jgi:hypothetical protein
MICKLVEDMDLIFTEEVRRRAGLEDWMREISLKAAGGYATNCLSYILIASQGGIEILISS